MSSISHGSDAARDERVSLSARQLQSIFPFHIIFDQEMRIVDCGDRLVRLSPALSTQDLFDEHFVINRPRGINTFEAIRQQLGALYIVQLRCSPIQLRGQMVLLQPDLIALLCSPLVRSISEMESLGLSLQDFPLHDPTGDLLFLLQAQRTTIEDAKALNVRLLAINESLKKYVPQNFLRLLEKDSLADV
jgi:hypothetical protein